MWRAAAIEEIDGCSLSTPCLPPTLNPNPEALTHGPDITCKPGETIGRSLVIMTAQVNTAGPSSASSNVASSSTTLPYVLHRHLFPHPVCHYGHLTHLSSDFGIRSFTDLGFSEDKSKMRLAMYAGVRQPQLEWFRLLVCLHAPRPPSGIEPGS